MNKEFALELIKLLSALESWGLAKDHQIPDYLHDRLCNAMGTLAEEVLKP